MAKKRVYVSFDYDHDSTLKEFLVGQAKLPDSPFELADWSIKEPITGAWKDKARTRIRSVDVAAVICGLHTDTATGVSAEVTIAQEEKKPYFLLAGYADKTNKKPESAKDTGSKVPGSSVITPASRFFCRRFYFSFAYAKHAFSYARLC